MRRAVSRLLMAGSAMLLLLACATPSGAGRLPRYGGALRITVAALPASLDPLQLGSDDGALIAGCLYEGLTRWDSTGAGPALARHWTHDDEAQRWRFTLRNDALFHDGSRCDAAAVARALERLADPRQSPYAWLLADLNGWDDFAAGRAAHVEGIEVLGASDIELDFAARASDVPARLALPIAGIGRRKGNEWLGTGPFEVAGPAVDVLRLVASRDHATGRPYLDRVEFATGADTAGTLFDTGRIARVRPTDNDPAGTTRWRSAASRLGFLLVNPQSAALDTEASRHKLALGFDRSVCVRVLLHGDGEATEDLVLGNVRRVSSRNGGVPGDLGGGEGQHVRVIVSQSEPVLRALGERLQLHLYALGLRADLDALPAADLRLALAQGRYDVAVLGWTPPQPDTELLMPAMALQYLVSAVLQPALGASMPDSWLPARLASAREPGAVLLRSDLCIPLVFFHDLWQAPSDVLHLGVERAGPGLDLGDTHCEPHWP